ncbi:transposase [Xanthomonas fragariae LMG 25863]|nr:transposase [Xanthomonas fragariae LMG 25863]
MIIDDYTLQSVYQGGPPHGDDGYQRKKSSKANMAVDTL